MKELRGAGPHEHLLEFLLVNVCQRVTETEQVQACTMSLNPQLCVVGLWKGFCFKPNYMFTGSFSDFMR